MPQLRTETSVTDLQHFFEYSAAGVEVLADGLQEISSASSWSSAPC